MPRHIAPHFFLLLTDLYSVSILFLYFAGLRFVSRKPIIGPEFLPDFLCTSGIAQ
jgi:hypothetical protein